MYISYKTYRLASLRRLIFYDDFGHKYSGHDFSPAPVHMRLAVIVSDSGPDINRAKAWAIAHKIDGVVASIESFELQTIKDILISIQ